MKYLTGMALSMIVGILIGASGMHTLNAQGSLPAYSITESEITDQAGYAPIQAVLRAENEKAGGKFIVRGAAATAVEGPLPPRVTITQWKSVDDAKKYYANPAVKKANEDRKKFSKNVRTYIVEGTTN